MVYRCMEREGHTLLVHLIIEMLFAGTNAPRAQLFSSGNETNGTPAAVIYMLFHVLHIITMSILTCIFDQCCTCN